MCCHAVRPTASEVQETNDSIIYALQRVHLLVYSADAGSGIGFVLANSSFKTAFRGKM